MWDGNLATGERLGPFNRRWARRLDALRRWAPAPWWAPGLKLTPELHQACERYCPIAEYVADLRWLLAPGLPSPDWLPQALRAPGPPAFDSLADFWRALPAWLAGRITWRAEELLPLVCALAAPPQFGTRAGRYPVQMTLLREWRRGCPFGVHTSVCPQHGTLSVDTLKCELQTVDTPKLLLDVGCGTGQGTWELVELLRDDDTAMGVTREPLEAWMATTRRLPLWGDAPGAYAFPPRGAGRGIAPTFAAGDFWTFASPAPADVLVVNGLIGGAALPVATPAAAAAVWARLTALTAPGGLLLVGDHFHAGRQPAVERFAAAAPTPWRVPRAGRTWWGVRG